MEEPVYYLQPHFNLLTDYNFKGKVLLEDNFSVAAKRGTYPMKCFKALQSFRGKKQITIGKTVFFLLIPVVDFYLLESYEHNPFQEVRGGAQCFNILLLELFAGILFFLIGRAGWALGIETVIVMIFGIINHYVMAFRSTPFVPWDIFSAGTAASVASNYDFTPSMRMVIVTLCFLLILTGLYFFSCQIEWKWYQRLIPASVLCIVICMFTRLLQDEDFQIRNRLYPYLFTPAYMTKVNGMLVTFVMDLAYVVVDKPSGYHADETGEQLLAYAREETVETEELPNIIVVMDEAFSDLAVLGDFTVNEDYMPFVHSLQQGAENTVTGYLNVSVCGGNTANTEFEFLTGNTMAFLPNGSIPFQQYIKGGTPSIVSHLASLGYDTYGCHPYLAGGWERDVVYPRLGFGKMLFWEDYDSPSVIRKYVDDASCVNQIISIYEKKQEGVPLFIFTVTMQNHGGYTDAYANFTPDIHLSEVSSMALEQYLSLIKVSDQELKRLISYFQEQEEKTVIVFFGDHQPNDYTVRPIQALNGIDSDSLTNEQLAARYQVPYVIWANYGIAEETGKDTSVNYLGAEVLSAAGIPTSAYQNYLLDLKKQYPLISAMRLVKSDEEGNWQELSLEEIPKELEEYQKFQYYQLFDWKEDAE